MPSNEWKLTASHIELMAAATATIVSLGSLYLSVRQTSVQERQLAASVWPSLAYDTNNVTDGKHSVRFFIKNGGVGPARVKSLEVRYHDKPMTGFKTLLTDCCDLPGHPEKIRAVNITPSMQGRIIGPGQELTFLTVDRAPEGEDPFFAQLDLVRWDVDGRVCFCSALDQCWSVGFKEHEPSPVQDCAAEAKRPQYVQ